MYTDASAYSSAMLHRDDLLNCHLIHLLPISPGKR